MDDNEKCVYLKANNKSVSHTKCEFFYYWHKDEWWLNNIHAFLSTLVLAVLHVALTRLTHKWRKKVNIARHNQSPRFLFFGEMFIKRSDQKPRRQTRYEALKSWIMMTTIYLDKDMKTFLMLFKTRNVKDSYVDICVSGISLRIMTLRKNLVFRIGSLPQEMLSKAWSCQIWKATFSEF